MQVEVVRRTGDWADGFAAVDRLCDEGRILDAYERAQAIGPLAQWSGTKARLLAARLLFHLGSSWRATRIVAEEFRRRPGDPLARFWRALVVGNDRGPLQMLRLLRRVPRPDDPRILSDWLTLEVRALTALRDLDRAEECHRAIDQNILGEGHWLALRAGMLMAADRHADALVVARRAAEADPACRVALHQVAGLLELLDRRAEALSFLRETEPALQVGQLTLHRSAIEHEAGLYEDEARSLARYEALTPLCDAGARRAQHARWSDNSYARGEVARALEHAREVDTKFFKALSKNLADSSRGRRRCRLPVGMIVQHDMTCAPATLAMLCAYFGDPVDHVRVADQICYEGTAAHSERRWVEERGWISKEFTLTWESAVRLLDRGIPVAVVTVEAASAHMQALVGYDEARGSFWLRDPNTSRLLEANAAQFLERYAPYGPRAHVLAPPSHAERLEGIEFTDASAYDHLYRLNQALERHDRERARDLADSIAASDAPARFTWWARRAIAVYDKNPYEIQRCSEALLELYPDEPNAQLSVLDCMAETATPQERAERLHAMATHSAPPPFVVRYAELLLDDARQHDRARTLLERTLARAPLSATVLAALARVGWLGGDRQRAFELFRFAACLEPTNEDHARAVLQAGLVLHRMEEVLPFLKARQERAKERSTRPATTLFDALEAIGQVEDAFAMLDALADERPDDDALVLFAAAANARYGRSQRSEMLLERARACAPEAQWRRAAATIAAHDGQLGRALEHWRGILEVEPFAVDAHRAVTDLLAELEGLDVARNHLGRACAEYPHNVALATSRVDWLRGHDPEEVERAIRRLLDLSPRNAWAHREAALLYSDIGRREEALEACATARSLEPRNPSTAIIDGIVLERFGRHAEARERFREAVALDADVPMAIHSLIGLFPSAADRTQELERLEPILFERSIHGDGLIAWYRLATALIPPHALSEKLDGLAAKRSRFPAARHVLVQQYLRLGRLGDAQRAVEEALALLPHSTLLLSDRADVCAAQGDVAGEIESALRWVETDRDAIPAILRLSEAHARGGDLEQARATLLRGLEQHPRCAPILERLAQLDYNAGDPRRAVALLERAVRIAPEQSNLWDQLGAWCAVLERPDRVAALAREISAARPWNAQVWLCLGTTLHAQRELEAALEALNGALERDPTLVEAADMRAVVLVHLGLKDAALEACKARTFTGRAAAALEARAAWILAVSGDVEKGIESMRAVVERHPDHLWSFQMLADWNQHLGRTDAALEAAKKIVELAPLEPASYGYLGDAQREAGDDAAALANFERAVRIAPTYRFACENAIALSVRRGDIEAAERIVELAAAHHPRDVRAVWAMQISAARRDWPALEQQMAALAGDPTASPDALSRAQSLLSEHDREATVRALSRLARDPTSHAETGALLVRAQGRAGSEPGLFLVRRLADHHPRAAISAAREVFDQLGEQQRSLRTLVALLWLGSIALHDDECWGKVGYALTSCRWYVLGAFWLRRYRDRPAARAWMLHNARVCYLETARVRAAIEVAEHALGLPTDDCSLGHLAFVSLAASWSGDRERAASLLVGVSADAVQPNDRWTFRMADALVALEAAEAVDRPVFRETAWSVLAELGRAHAVTVFGNGMLYRRGARAIYRASPTLRGFFWANLPLVLIALAVVSNASGFGFLAALLVLYIAGLNVATWLRR